jgi:uncharacterized protein YacL
MLLVRILLVLVSSYLGFLFTLNSDLPIEQPVKSLVGIGLGLLLSLLVVAFEVKLRNMPFKNMISGLAGLIIGLIVSMALTGAFSPFVSLGGTERRIYLLIYCFFVYLGMTLAYKKAEHTDFSKYLPSFITKGEGENYKLLDTSVIIDGRIYDICETDFLEGVLIVPQFVLRELQHIADSSDSLKRNRGRRGLDVLNKLQKLSQIEVRVVDQDFPKIAEVDAKLVALAKQMRAKILTNDFNLNKVAELQGVSVLNINLLANALKPVVLPGEIMSVYLLKEGKESGQAVAYLDDGTMVVVDNAREYLGTNTDVAVTSVLQTTAGRMIFARLKETGGESESSGRIRAENFR